MIIASDGSKNDTEIFSIIVNNVDAPPVINAIADQVINEAEFLEINPEDGTDDLDADGEEITYLCTYDTVADGVVGADPCTNLSGITLTANPGGGGGVPFPPPPPPPAGTFTGTVQFFPDLSQAGTYEFKITGTSGALTDEVIYVVTVNDIGSLTQTKIVASDGAAGDKFATSVAISGNRAIVSSRQDDDAGTSTGSAYIYDYNSGTGLWDQTKITAGDMAAGDWFGWDVDIDGDRAIVGAERNTDAGSFTGSAYIYQYNSGTGLWDETKLLAADRASGDRFGTSVAIDGDVAVVGALYNDDNGTDSGSAYIFEYNSGTGLWDQTKVLAADGVAGDRFGSVVAVSGTTVMVSSYLDNSAIGAVYFYEKNAGTGLWDQTKITPSDPVAGDAFGVAIDIDGDTALISSKNNNSYTGKVYVFRKNAGTGLWEEDTQIFASDKNTNDNFGTSVSIDGNRAVIGSSNAPVSNQSYASYIYNYNASTDEWEEIRFTGTGVVTMDWFGSANGVSGNNIILGAYGDDDVGSDEGAAYIFELDLL